MTSVLNPVARDGQAGRAWNGHIAAQRFTGARKLGYNEIAELSRKFT
jgi:hypothetical protein